MMHLTLLPPGTTEVGPTFSFDYTRADFSLEANVTEHPVEVGAEVTDHVQVRPLRFQVDAIVTDTPLSLVPVPFAVNRAVLFLEGAVGQQLDVTLDAEGTFRGCVLESVGHGKTVMGGRTFACRFRKIRIAAALSVPIPARMPAPVAAAGGPSEAGLGQQASTTIPDTSALFAARAFALSMLGL